MIKMVSELDKIKSTITISLGTKNRLRDLKGSQSYEEFINYLIRTRNIVPKPENIIEFNKFRRTKGIYSFEEYKILFSYNKFDNSSNFIFDIKIENVRKVGKQIPYEDFIKDISSKVKNNLIMIEYKLYFELLHVAIQKEIEPQFKHNGRIEDYYSWKEEFKLLNLPENSFKEDVMDKLNSFNNKQGVFE